MVTQQIQAPERALRMTKRDSHVQMCAAAVALFQEIGEQYREQARRAAAVAAAEAEIAAAEAATDQERGVGGAAYNA